MYQYGPDTYLRRLPTSLFIFGGCMNCFSECMNCFSHDTCVYNFHFDFVFSLGYSFTQE